MCWATTHMKQALATLIKLIKHIVSYCHSHRCHHTQIGSNKINSSLASQLKHTKKTFNCNLLRLPGVNIGVSIRRNSSCNKYTYCLQHRSSSLQGNRWAIPVEVSCCIVELQARMVENSGDVSGDVFRVHTRPSRDHPGVGVAVTGTTQYY